MKIGFDARCLQTASAAGGVGRYARGLVEHLPLPGDEMLVYVSGRRPAPDLPASPARRLVALSRPARGITLVDPLAWPARLRRDGIEVFHSPFYGVPARGGRGKAIVATVHDIIPVLFDGAVTPRQKAIFRRHFRSALSAHRIIVPSRRTRDDLAEHFRADPRRIAVVPPGLEARFLDGRPGPQEGASPGPGAFRQRVAGGRPYILNVGGFDPVKDLSTLLAAFARVGATRPDLALVVCGEPHGRKGREFTEAVARAGLRRRVVVPGRLDDAELAAAYAGAELFAFPSRYEGFGLPPLEAMAKGCPVVSSSGGSLQEVLGEAALLVPPGDFEALARGIERLLDDAEMRRRLAEAGRRRADAFGWPRAARDTTGVYRRALAEARGEGMTPEEAA